MQWIHIGYLKDIEKTNMENTLLKEYVKLEEKFKALEEERTMLRLQILKDLKKNKVEKVESEYGFFTVCTKVLWIYTDAVRKLEEKAKIAKVKEQQRGLAKAVELEYLLFKANK